MATEAICDTNVFRYLGAGDLSLSDIQALVPGARLSVSPASILELASRYTADSFEHRREAARSILSTAATVLPDPETYLTRDVFGLPLRETEFDWTQAVKAMAAASDLPQLIGGVADYQSRVRRTVNLNFARNYREGVDREFITDMLQLQKNEVLGFANWWNPDPQQRTGPPPRFDRQQAENFLQNTQSSAFYLALLQGAHARALLKTSDAPSWPPTKESFNRLAKAAGDLNFYFHIYRRYLYRILATGMLAKGNDWFDLEVMIYSRDKDHVILTTDKKWESMAREEGMGDQILRLRP